MEILIGLLILYIIQAVLIYGMTYGYFEGKFPNQDNMSVAGFQAITAGFLPVLGPFLVFFLSEGIKYGLRWKR